MSDSHDISVIIPTYYRNETLVEAIESQLSQTIEPAEIIVIDDSGEAHAEEVCRQYDEVYYVPLDENQGPQVAREIGLQNCSGQFVQFFDDDDSLRKDAYEKRLDLLSGDGNVGVVYSGIQWDDGRKDRPAETDTGDILAAALAFDIDACTTSNMLIQRKYLETLRPITGEYTGAGDLALNIWLAEQCEFDFVDEPLLQARGTRDSLGVSEQAIESRFRIIEDFEDLYDQYPRTVKNQALSDTYSLEGRRHLTDNVWSASAIGSFARAAYYEPGISSFRIVELIAALGGRPTRDLASWVSRVR